MSSRYTLINVDSADAQSTDALDSSVELHEVTVIEKKGAHNQTKYDIEKKENTQGLLKELARLGQSSQLSHFIYLKITSSSFSAYYYDNRQMSFKWYFILVLNIATNYY
uniref:Uncharacterized protein n=1 Tax=Heterorhabditis bacteriophora TaxID=37862 RepID=A0A1I7WG54_HETBA